VPRLCPQGRSAVIHDCRPTGAAAPDYDILCTAIGKQTPKAEKSTRAARASQFFYPTPAPEIVALPQ